MSFVNMLYQGSSASSRKFYPGPDIFGNGTPLCVEEPLEFITSELGLAKRGDAPKGWKPADSYQITIAGYSRGAYSALRVAHGLAKLGVKVHYLCLIDTVKVSTSGQEAVIAQIFDRYDASFDIATDDRKMRSALWAEPGQSPAADLHGRRLLSEVYVADKRDAKAGAGNYVDPAGHYVIPSNVSKALSVQRSPAANSWMEVMGTAPVTFPGGSLTARRDFVCTHSAMGGMPFRGDQHHNINLTPESEWAACRQVAQCISDDASKAGILRSFQHPVLRYGTPPASWMASPQIQSGIQARNQQLAEQEKQRREIERLKNPRRAVLPWEK